MKGAECMLPSRKKKNENQSIGMAILSGICVSVVVSVLLSVFLAVLVLNERVSESAIGYCTALITMIGSLSGCLAAGKKCNEKLAILFGSVGVIYLFILVGMGVLFFDGGFHNLGLRLLAAGVGCVISCAICIRGKGTKRKRKRAYR